MDVLHIVFKPNRDKVSLIRRYTGGGTVVVDENTGNTLEKYV